MRTAIDKRAKTELLNTYTSDQIKEVVNMRKIKPISDEEKKELLEILKRPNLFTYKNNYFEQENGNLINETNKDLTWSVFTWSVFKDLNQYGQFKKLCYNDFLNFYKVKKMNFEHTCFADTNKDYFRMCRINDRYVK